MSAFGSSAGQDQATALCCHTSPKTKLPVSLHSTGLVGSFSFVTHEIISNFYIALRGYFLLNSEDTPPSGAVYRLPVFTSSN